MEKIRHTKKPYIYYKIINSISKNENEITLLKYNESNKQKVFENLKNYMKEFAKANGINQNEVDSNEVIIPNLSQIYLALKDLYINQNLIKKKQEHLQILKNLLFSLQNNEQEDNETDNNIVKINDFIITYIEECSKLLFGTKFEDKDYNRLIDTFLYLIFQVKEEKFIRMLKIVTYEYFYEHKNINQFIKETSDNINNLNKYDDETLKKYQNKYNEFGNLNILELSKNYFDFFNLKKKWKNEDILKYFTPKNIEKNYKMINDKPSLINSENIVVDSLKYDENKLHLFSPEFLISNGLKSQIELNDMEMFNDDNYAVDVFSKYINQIIEKINESINNGDFNTNYIKNNLIKINQLDFLHYISAKLDYNIIRGLESQKNNYIKNAFIRLKIGDEYDKKIKSENSASKSSISKSKLSDYQKKYSEYLESIINEKLIKNIDNKDLISLPNILFMFNLKIPILDKTNNSLMFKSLHLDFFHPEKKGINDNYYYGCKEIDAIFQSKSEKEYNVLDSQYFHTNITFVKQKNDTEFFLKEKNDFSIFPKSVVFCEIKNTFPNTQKGNEDVLKIPIAQNEEIKKDYSICYIDDKDPLYSYNNQLIKLIKKFKYFFNTFRDNIVNKEDINLHMILIYDTINIDNNKYKDIQDLTKRQLNKYKYKLEEMNNNNVIFELVFFDYFQMNKDIKIQLEEEKKKVNQMAQIKQENDNLKQENNTLKQEKNTLIQEKNNLIQKEKEKDENIQKIINDSSLSLEEKLSKIQKLC